MLLPRPLPGDPHVGETWGLYVHVPFCARLCSYCDFYKMKERPDVHRAYVDALARGAEAAGRDAVRVWPAVSLGSIYVGGGTPTALGAELLCRLLRSLTGSFPVGAGAEVTVECNPEDAGDDVLDAAREAGATRLSIGVQSLVPEELVLLHRSHDPEQSRAALTRVRRAGFQSVSVDVILGLPGQDEAAATRTIEGLAGMGPDHVSAYLLELDKDVPIGRRIARGELPAPDDVVQAQIYGLAGDVLGGAGFERYELSSFARAGHRSRHNLGYWTDAPYLGLGPSAASYLGDRRFTRRPDLGAFLAAPVADLADEGAYELERCFPERRARDAFMLGLRLREGVDPAWVLRRHGAHEALDRDISALEAEGLLDVMGCRRSIPERYLPVANFVFARLLG